MNCYSCEQNALTDPPPRESIVRTDQWRAAHAIGTSLPGWLVLLPLRHVISLDELTDDESAEVGPLLGGLSAALRSVTSCEKTYVILLAEAQGFAHVHFHVVPRMSWFTDEQRGPNVFNFLREPEAAWVPAEEMDRISVALREQMVQGKDHRAYRDNRPGRKASARGDRPAEPG